MDALPSGSVAITTAARAKLGMEMVPDAPASSITELWCGMWTDREMQNQILEGMLDGEGLDEVLAELGKKGRVPTKARVHRWLLTDKAFEAEYRAAQSVRGEQMAELAFQEAMAITPDSARATAVKVKHLEWQASKLARRVYGEAKAEEITGHRDISDEELDRRIESLLKNRDLQRVLPKVLDITPDESGQTED